MVDTVKCLTHIKKNHSSCFLLVNCGENAIQKCGSVRSRWNAIFYCHFDGRIDDHSLLDKAWVDLKGYDRILLKERVIVISGDHIWFSVIAVFQHRDHFSCFPFHWKRLACERLISWLWTSRTGWLFILLILPIAGALSLGIDVITFSTSPQLTGRNENCCEGR